MSRMRITDAVTGIDAVRAEAVDRLILRG